MAFSCQLQCPYDYTDMAEIIVTEINPSTLPMTVSKPILSAGYLHEHEPCLCSTVTIKSSRKNNLKSTHFLRGFPFESNNKIRENVLLNLNIAFIMMACILNYSQNTKVAIAGPLT